MGDDGLDVGPVFFVPGIGVGDDARAIRFSSVPVGDGDLVGGGGTAVLPQRPASLSQQGQIEARLPILAQGAFAPRFARLPVIKVGVGLPRFGFTGDEEIETAVEQVVADGQGEAVFGQAAAGGQSGRAALEGAPPLLHLGVGAVGRVCGQAEEVALQQAVELLAASDLFGGVVGQGGAGPLALPEGGAVEALAAGEEGGQFGLAEEEGGGH